MCYSFRNFLIFCEMLWFLEKNVYFPEHGTNLFLFQWWICEISYFTHLIRLISLREHGKGSTIDLYSANELCWRSGLKVGELGGRLGCGTWKKNRPTLEVATLIHLYCFVCFLTVVQGINVAARKSRFLRKYTFWVLVKKKKYYSSHLQNLQNDMWKLCWEQIPDGPDQFEKLSEVITLFSKYMVTQKKTLESGFDFRQG
jgi:hypothetical protein